MKRVLVVLVVLCMVLSVSASDFLSVSIINQDPDPALTGNIVELRIGVTNEGSIATEDMVVEFEEEYPFFVVPGESSVKEVGYLGAYGAVDNQKTLKFRLQVDNSAPAGSYELSFLQYEKGQKDLGAVRVDIPVDIKSKEGVEVIYIDRASIVPGTITPIKFVVNNVGSAPLRDLSFSWENEEGVVLPVGSDNTKYIKSIAIGEDAELVYNVVADSDADPGLYRLDLSLYYDDPVSGLAQQISTIAGIYVGGGTDFDVSFSESSSGDTSFTVANIGSNPATSVMVSVPNQQGWRVSGSKSSIIGNLNKGDYTVATFQLSSGRSAMLQGEKDEGQQLDRSALQVGNTVTIQIAYTDTMGQRQVVDKEVEVNMMGMMGATMAADGAGETPAFNGRMRPGARTNTSYFVWPIVIVALGVGAYFGYKHLKKRKSKKK